MERATKGTRTGAEVIVELAAEMVQRAIPKLLGDRPYRKIGGLEQACRLAHPLAEQRIANGVAGLLFEQVSQAGRGKGD